MLEILGMLAFTVLIVGQFAAVIAVHGWQAAALANQCADLRQKRR